jgi:hypothetical protein
LELTNRNRIEGRCGGATRQWTGRPSSQADTAKVNPAAPKRRSSVLPWEISLLLRAIRRRGAGDSFRRARRSQQRPQEPGGIAGRRAESSSQGKIELYSMGVKRRQGSGDQKDLFDEALKASLRHGVAGEGGTGAGTREERQAPAAWDRGRTLAQHLMERIASSANLNQAYKRVKANGGAPGVDGVTVAALRPWIAKNRERLIASLLDGSYRPKPVRGVEIPKPGGGMRQLGIPTLLTAWCSRRLHKSWNPSSTPDFRRRASGSVPDAGRTTPCVRPGVCG